MSDQRGFEVFLNGNGTISIKQLDPLTNHENLVVLSKSEADALQGFLLDLMPDTVELIEEIEEMQEGEQNDGNEPS
jgi:adenylate kinase family enzyme